MSAMRWILLLYMTPKASTNASYMSPCGKARETYSGGMRVTGLQKTY